MQISRLYAYSADVPEGQAMAQNPEAGSEVQQNSIIEVTFSQGLEMITMPDLLNQPLEDARDLLTELGLNVGDIEYVASDQPRAMSWRRIRKLMPWYRRMTQLS